MFKQRRWSRIFLFLLVFTLLAPVVPTGALALSETDPLLHANLSRADFSFDYVPFANSEYAVYIFSEEGGPVNARVQLLDGGDLIAAGDGFGEVLSAWLVAGRKYSVRVHGSGRAVIEVARRTMSRCFSDPLPAEENEARQKMIAREYDAHWYSFTAGGDGLMMLSCVPEDQNLSTSAALFDESGALVSYFDSLPGGACMLLAETQAGKNYFVRICAPAGGTGYYSLKLSRANGPDFSPALQFFEDEYALAEGDVLPLGEEIRGEALLWVSENPDVAAVNQDGSVIGLAPGEAQLRAYGLTSSAACLVLVEYVELEGLAVIEEEISFAAGQQAEVSVMLTPANASRPRLRFIVEDTSIAAVSSAGVVTGIAPGETMLTVRSADGRFADYLRLRVTPAQRSYRALLIGEQSYPFSENTERKGSANSVEAIAALLETAEMENGGFAVSTASDLSRAELIARIRTSFAGAGEQDVSLLYITCHGSYTGGMSFLELSDGSSLSVRDLERELRAIPGTIVVLIDCCGSGGAIGAASDYAAFARGVTGAFSGAAIRGSKYKVICSAGLDQDSFRIAFNEEAASGVMATVFARALCDGAGWSIDRGERTAMGADWDYNGEITLDEIFRYMEARVNWYLEIASALTGEEYRQSVQVYPEGDPFILFER